VTGIGAVSALGPDVSALRAGLREGRSGIGALTRFAYGGRSDRAAEVPLEGAGAPPNGIGRLSHADRLARAAAREAVRAAGLAAGDLATATLVVGSTTGGMRVTEEHYWARARGDETRYRLSRLLATPLSTPTDVVAQDLGIGGARRTVATACSSSALAIGLAVETIRRGRTPLAIVVGTDQLCRLTYAGFDALQALDAEPCRPFDRMRRGLTLGEGAGALVLEDLAHARARGARPAVLLAGWATSSDGHHPTAPHPEGAGAIRALAGALADADRSPEAVDYVNAHGSATSQNDAVEMRVLRAVLGARLGSVAVSGTKSQIGHCLGAAGALEAVATIVALEDGLLPPTLRVRDPDPEWEDVDLVRDAGRTAPIARALSASYGFGGHNVVLCFERADA
jgi:3-oxoacyl-[acyl-carrier-protein] synthase II